MKFSPLWTGLFIVLVLLSGCGKRESTRNLTETECKNSNGTLNKKTGQCELKMSESQCKAHNGKLDDAGQCVVSH